MDATNTKRNELTDIPLSLEQGDGVDIAALRSDKLKTNSLKRFFRLGKGFTSKGTTTSDSSNSSDIQNSPSFQLRYGSFHPSDEFSTTEEEAGSSKSKTTASTESRISLSKYVDNLFKKITKKSPTTEVQPRPADAIATEANQP